MYKKKYSYHYTSTPYMHKYAFGENLKQWGKTVGQKISGLEDTFNNSPFMSGAGSFVSEMANKAINPDGNRSDVGDFLSNAGQMVKTVSPFWGTVIDWAGKLGNAAFGSNVNEEDVSRVSAESLANRDALALSGNWDSLMNNWSAASKMDANIGGSQGWFNNDLDRAQARANAKKQNALAAAQVGADNIMSEELRNLKNNLMADGGPIFGTKYDIGLSFINNGGTHEENPYGGVFFGVAPDGQPNQVEEDEVVFNDYVYSNRIPVPKAVRNKYKMRDKKDLSFADAVKDYVKKNGIDERENDPIAMRGFEAFAMDMAQNQEEVKAKREMRRQQNSFKDGGRRRLLTGYPNRNPKNVSETLANMVGTVRGLGMTEAQLDSLETDRRQKENLMSILGGDRSEWWKLSPTWNTPFWNEEKRKPGTFSNPPTVDRGPISNVKKLQEGLDLILKRAAEGREEAKQSYESEGQEEINQRYSFAEGGHLYENGSRLIGTTGKTSGQLWNDYSFQGLEKIFSDALARYQGAATDAERNQIRTDLMNTVNGVQSSYAGIYRQPGTRATYDPRVAEHQTLFGKTGGNYGFNGIDSDITRTYKGHTGDNAAGGFGADGLYGWRTSIRHFGSDADTESADNMATIAGMADQMNLGWNPTLDYGTSGNKLYTLSLLDNKASTAPEGIKAGKFTIPTSLVESANAAAANLGNTAPKPEIPAEPAEDESKYDPSYWWNLRNAGLAANMAGLAYNMFDPYKPPMADEIGPFSPIRASFIGDYMRYNPMDINFASNQQAAQNAATRNALMQSASPSRNAALLAADYSGNLQQGNLYRQGLEYNDALKKAVTEFNRGTNQFNVQMALDASARNQAARQAWYEDRLRQAQGNISNKIQHKIMKDQAIGQGITAIADYLRDMDKEDTQGSWIDALTDSGVFGTLNAPMTSIKQSTRRARKQTKSKGE